MDDTGSRTDYDRAAAHPVAASSEKQGYATEDRLVP